MKNKPIYRCRVNKRWRSTAYGLICFWVIKDLFVHQMQSLNILIKEIIAAFLIHLDWRYSPSDGFLWLDEVLNAIKVSSTQQYLISPIIFFLQNYSQARNLAEKIQNFVDKLFALICGPNLKSDAIKYNLLKYFLLLLLFADLVQSIFLIFSRVH